MCVCVYLYIMCVIINDFRRLSSCCCCCRCRRQSVGPFVRQECIFFFLFGFLSLPVRSTKRGIKKKGRKKKTLPETTNENKNHTDPFLLPDRARVGTSPTGCQRFALAAAVRNTLGSFYIIIIIIVVESRE